MLVSSKNVNIDITDSNTNTQNTSSSIYNSGNSYNDNTNGSSTPSTRDNTAFYQNPNANNTDIEEIDLSSNLEQNSNNEAAPQESTPQPTSLMEKISGLANNIGETGSKVLSGIKEFAVDGIKSIGSTLSETASNVSSNVGALNDAVAEAFTQGPKSLVATGAVLHSSVTSGVLKIAEHIGDSLVKTKGLVVEDASWMLGKAVGLVNKDAGEKITAAGKEFNNTVKEFIAKDIVGDVNEWFYEKTPVGQWLNENSTVKYDSKEAKALRNATEKAATIAAATAVTVATGGIAGAFALGTLYGYGKAAESTYQNKGTDTTGMDELKMLGSGALTGLSWMATGKLTAGFIDIGKTAAESGVKTVLSGISKDIVTKDFWINALKEGVTGMNGVGNVVSSAMMTGEDLLPYINGEKEWTTEGVTKLALKFTACLGLNIAEDALRGYVTDFDAGKLGNMANEAITKKAISEIGEKVSVSGIDEIVNGNNREIPVEYLVNIIKDPTYQSKLQLNANSGYFDDVDGFAKFEIGNALKSLKYKAKDIGFSEEEIGRMDKYVKDLSGDSYRILNKETMNLWSKLGQWDGQETLSPSEVKCLKLLSEIDDSGATISLPDGSSANEIFEYCSSFLYDTISKNNNVKIDSDTLDVFMKSAVKNSTDNVKLGNTLKNILGNNPNIQASQKNAALYNQLLKASDLGGFENDSYRMLKEFSEGYVPEEKLQRIIGSVKYETGEAFKKYGKPEGVTGFNNGKRSVIDLRYSIDSIKETVNHENVHQISHGGMQKTKDGYNAIKAGIQYTLVDPSSGKVLQCSGKGANECITELFNQLTMGKKTSSSWYNEGTGKLRDLMDTGIIDLSDIKKYYFSNDGAGLMKHLRNATTNLGIGDRSFDILDAFDKAIDNNVEVKTEGLKKLNSIIKSINMSVY